MIYLQLASIVMQFPLRQNERSLYQFTNLFYTNQNCISMVDRPGKFQADAKSFMQL